MKSFDTRRLLMSALACAVVSLAVVALDRSGLFAGMLDTGAAASAAAAHSTGTTTRAAAPAKLTKASTAGIVNINTASEEELLTLPGIGPTKAAAIVAYRSTKQFARIEDLMNVRGIGKAMFANLRDHVTVQAAAK